MSAAVFDHAAALIEHYGIRNAANGSRHIPNGGHWDRNRPGLSCSSALQIAYCYHAPPGHTCYDYLRQFERTVGSSVTDADAGRTTPAKIGDMFRACATSLR